MAKQVSRLPQHFDALPRSCKRNGMAAVSFDLNAGDRPKGELAVPGKYLGGDACFWIRLRNLVRSVRTDWARNGCSSSLVRRGLFTSIGDRQGKACQDQDDPGGKHGPSLSPKTGEEAAMPKTGWRYWTLVRHGPELCAQGQLFFAASKAVKIEAGASFSRDTTTNRLICPFLKAARNRRYSLNTTHPFESPGLLSI